MTPADFVALVLKNAARVHGYKLGHDGSDGLCDCIGLIIGAWRLGGNKWPWTHGSNYTARHLTRGLAHDQPLRLGDLVFKAREPGEAGYDLPSRYSGGMDTRDYYHVGCVTQLDPLRITHCTTVPGGIQQDSTRGKWRWSGQFSKLTEEATMEKQMIVQAANGGKVRLRSGPGRTYSIITELPTGERVTRLSQSDGWSYVAAGDRSGYIMDEFLVDAPAQQGGTLFDRVAAIRGLLDDCRGLLTQADEQLQQLQAEEAYK